MTNQNRTTQPPRGQSPDEQFRPQRDPQQDRQSQHAGSPNSGERSTGRPGSDEERIDENPEERSRSTKERENQGAGPMHVGDQSRTR
jgi:hypothetical protein